jgi:hypothetical protein
MYQFHQFLEITLGTFLSHHWIQQTFLSMTFADVPNDSPCSSELVSNRYNTVVSDLETRILDFAAQH